MFQLIACLASSFLNYWAGLHKQEDKVILETGAEAIKAAALHFHPNQDNGEEATDNGMVLLQ